MRTALITALAGAAAVVHYANGSPAGWTAYLFLAAVPVLSGIYASGLRGCNYWLSLTGLVEAWFLLDYCFYGTAVALLQRSKTPLPTSLDDAYSSGYAIGILALAAFAAGAHFGFAAPRPPDFTPQVSSFVSPGAWRIFFAFTAAGVASIVILLLDGESRRQIFYEHVGLSPREGMGRYTALLFMLPTTAVTLWFLSRPKRHYSAAPTTVGLSLLAAIHLGYGRRLMWAGTMLLIFHFLKVRGVFTIRSRHLAMAIPLVLAVSGLLETTKNRGWSTAVDPVHAYELADGQKIFDMVHNSVGRFDTTAALIVNRRWLPYYRGETFMLAPLQVLPVSAGMVRSRGVREELGEMIYGAFGKNLVSQETSLVGELYANFGSAGVLTGFLLVGLAAARLDARYHHSREPLVAAGYALCLFRCVHQLATASTSWFPLTFLAFLPWLCAVAATRMKPRRL